VLSGGDDSLSACASRIPSGSPWQRRVSIKLSYRSDPSIKRVLSPRSVEAVRNRPLKPARAYRPASPWWARMRAHLLADRRQRDAMLLVVLAYAGLRPQEALALPWAQRPRPHPAHRPRPKRRRSQDHQDRTHPLRAPPRTLRRRPRRMRLASGRPDGDKLAFPEARGRDHDWANWRRQVFGPLAATVGAPGMRPYELRHAFCSLLIARHLCLRHGRPLRQQKSVRGGRDPRGA
jgi:integrase